MVSFSGPDQDVQRALMQVILHGVMIRAADRIATEPRLIVDMAYTADELILTVDDNARFHAKIGKMIHTDDIKINVWVTRMKANTPMDHPQVYDREQALFERFALWHDVRIAQGGFTGTKFPINDGPWDDHDPDDEPIDPVDEARVQFEADDQVYNPGPG